MFIRFFFLKMPDITTAQNTDLSSWIVLYKYIWHNIDILWHIYSHNRENETSGPNQNGSIGSRLKSSELGLRTPETRPQAQSYVVIVNYDNSPLVPKIWIQNIPRTAVNPHIYFTLTSYTSSGRGTFLVFQPRFTLRNTIQNVSYLQA